MLFFKNFFTSSKHNQSNDDAAFLAQQLHTGDLMFAEILRPIKLDYELESLKELDYYLLKVRIYFQLNNQDAKSALQKGNLMNELMPVILGIGAYLGETLRKQNQKFNWTENALQMNNGNNAPSVAVFVLSNQKHTTSPMQEVINFICGEQQPNSLHEYAQTVLLL